jgi:hypothetical protein
MPDDVIAMAREIVAAVIARMAKEACDPIFAIRGVEVLEGRHDDALDVQAAIAAILATAAKAAGIAETLELPTRVIPARPATFDDDGDLIDLGGPEQRIRPMPMGRQIAAAIRQAFGVGGE